MVFGPFLFLGLSIGIGYLTGSSTVIAAKKDWEKSDKAKAIKEIIKAYHKDNVKKVIEESSEGMDQPVF